MCSPNFVQQQWVIAATAIGHSPTNYIFGVVFFFLVSLQFKLLFFPHSPNWLCLRSSAVHASVWTGAAVNANVLCVHLSSFFSLPVMDKLNVPLTTTTAAAPAAITLHFHALHVHLFLGHQSCRNISMNFDNNQNAIDLNKIEHSFTLDIFIEPKNRMNQCPFKAN